MAEAVRLEQLRIAKLLESGYRIVSHRGFYTGEEPDALAQLCSDLLADLAPNKPIVTFALREFFVEVSRKFDRLATDPSKWPTVDNAVLRGIRYLTKDGDRAEAIDITDAINMARLDWCGD